MDAKQKKVLIWGGIIVGGIAVAMYLLNKLTNINKGTPFEDTGAVGTLGNVTNQVLGGVPQAVGEKLSETLFDLTHDDFDDETYIFTFVDTKTKGAVNSHDVDSLGFFTYWRDKQRYRLKKDGKGARWAVRV